VLRAWLEFAACLAAIGYAGYHLTRYADAIAEKARISAGWAGLVLLATITSLPELMTGSSAVTVAGAPEIAIGDVLGSSVFNLFLLAVADAARRGQPIYAHASRGHIVSAAFGIALLGIVLAGLALGRAGPAVGHVGWYSPVIAAVYAFAIHAVLRFERRLTPAALEIAPRHPGLSLRAAVARYAMFAAAVIAAGVWLPFVGARLAAAMGWSDTFVGTLLVAIVTSMPEIVTTLAAVRIGAIDLAVGGVLGSNLFDVVIVAIDDLLYAKGPILADVSGAHAISATSAMVMSACLIGAFWIRPRRAWWINGTLAAVFLFNSWAVYRAAA
jgi:cation:H+ antiporter